MDVSIIKGKWLRLYNSNYTSNVKYQLSRGF